MTGSTSESRVYVYLVCLHLVIIRECVHGVGHMVGAAGGGRLARGQGGDVLRHTTYSWPGLYQPRERKEGEGVVRFCSGLYSFSVSLCFIVFIVAKQLETRKIKPSCIQMNAKWRNEKKTRNIIIQERTT